MKLRVAERSGPFTSSTYLTDLTDTEFLFGFEFERLFNNRKR